MRARLDRHRGLEAQDILTPQDLRELGIRLGHIRHSRSTENPALCALTELRQELHVDDRPESQGIDAHPAGRCASECLLAVRSRDLPYPAGVGEEDHELAWGAGPGGFVDGADDC